MCLDAFLEGLVVGLLEGRLEVLVDGVVVNFFVGLLVIMWDSD